MIHIEVRCLFEKGGDRQVLSVKFLFIKHMLVIKWSSCLSVSLLLLLLSHFSQVQFCVTPYTAAHQAPPSLGFSGQEHWSGLPFPSPMHESEKWKGNHSVVSDAQRPMDCSLPGSSVHGIFQARVLEKGAIAFSVILPTHCLKLFKC